MQGDDARVMRDRHNEIATTSDVEFAHPSVASPAVLVQTYTLGTYPTAAGRLFACKMVDVSGDETEGATPTFGTPEGPLFAANLGAVIPPTGTRLVVHQVDGYWMFRYG